LTARKNQNSILVLATLGVYLGLVLVGGALPVIGQATEQNAAGSDQTGIYINKRPLKDLLRNAAVQIESKKVDLDAAFKVTIKATIGLGKDGKTYILKKPTLVPGGNLGEAGMQKLGQDAVLAVGDAGWFGYLTKFEKESGQIRSVTVQVEQDETQFQAKVIAEQLDENSARTFASGLQGVLVMAGTTVQGDEAIFLTSTTATSNGKDLCLTFVSPKKVFRELIERKMAEQKEAAK